MTSGVASSQAGVGPVLMMELNELCPPILDRMMARGDLPNFKALHSRSDVHVTWTDDADLEPWVQWVTLHTGQRQDVHGAKELDEGYRVDLPRVWDSLAGRGFRSLVFGSMNPQTISDTGKIFLVPDPWSTRVACTDPAFKPFHDFVSFNVTEHTNARARATKGQTAAFVRFMLARGLSLATAMEAVRQIAGEKVHGGDRRWRRSLLLDLMMWDVFEREYARRRPDFATFFANSTAFLQHRYWRHMDPGAYQVKPDAAEMAAFGDAVETSYRHMDKLIGRAAKLVGPRGRIVFATGLSQEANLRYEHLGGKYVYRPHYFDALNAFMGGPEKVTFQPVMTHQAWASCETSGDADRFEAGLEGLQANGDSIMWWKRSGNRVFFWNKFISRVEDDLVIHSTITGQRKDFTALFALVGQVNNSQHNRNGAFWVERDDARGAVHPGKLPLEQAAQLILDLFPTGGTPALAPAHVESRETVAA